MTEVITPPIVVRDLHGHYGQSHVLHGMNFEVRRSEVVTLLGRNGAGKTSTLRAIIGILGKRSGSVIFEGVETINLTSDRIASIGLGYCPEERGIFSALTVHENLLLPPVLKPGGMTVDEIHELFPRLKERAKSQGTKLSGGEQQMLAIARILRTGAKTLLLDEPTEGLAPIIVQHIGEIIRTLKQRGYTIVLVEQNLRFAMSVADRHYVVEHGHVVDEVSNDQLRSTPERLDKYLSV
ncbi:MAG: ABC transporter ATP-binding protein [Pseudomonadota bacterium]